ncbi:hypothetical protein C0989_003996 [Termitomyces sp. Mn162]|nr:hypothetical protein C0989_003996 [Termitomyces sp. Mn162]
MDNFIDKFLAVLAPHHLQHLSTLILLKLFDGDPTPARDITHYLEMTMTFANGQQQELQLLITKLHPSIPVILGFSWLRSTNSSIDWPSLTLCLDWNNPTNSGLVPFNVSPSSENPETTIDHFWTPCSSALGPHGHLSSMSELMACPSPTTIEITQYHDNTLTLDNYLQFQAQLLVTQLPPSTLIMLRLLWLQDVNPDINWKNLTIQFPGPKASLVATIPLCLQSISDSNISNPGTNASEATQSPSTSNSNPEGEENATLPQSPSIKIMMAAFQHTLELIQRPVVLQPAMLDPSHQPCHSRLNYYCPIIHPH